jgi:hypothetical protein
MQHITSPARLKNAIRLLETEQAIQGQLLKEQFCLTIQSLKPVNLLKSKWNNIVSSPHLIENILGIALSIATGYLIKKLVVGTSGKIVRKLIGSVLQIGVTNLVVQHPEAIKSFSRFIVQHIRFKKSQNSGNLDS